MRLPLCGVAHETMWVRRGACLQRRRESCRLVERRRAAPEVTLNRHQRPRWPLCGRGAVVGYASRAAAEAGRLRPEHRRGSVDAGEPRRKVAPPLEILEWVTAAVYLR